VLPFENTPEIGKTPCPGTFSSLPPLESGILYNGVKIYIPIPFVKPCCLKSIGIKENIT